MAFMTLRIFQAFLLLFTFCKINSFDDNDFYGIAYIAKTVYDLDKSVKFYTEVMDGMLIREFQARGLRDDSHFYRMFQKEIIEARNRGMSLDQIGVPDISSFGSYVLNWDFVLFDNGLVWLLQFTDFNGRPFMKYDTSAGSAKSGYGHMAMVVDNNINPYQMMQDIYKGQQDLNSEFAGFTSAIDVNSYQERNRLFPDNYDAFLTSEFGGFRLANTLGMDGEKIELSFRRGIGQEDNFKSFCETKAVHSSMLSCCNNGQNTNAFKKPRVRTNGFHHISITVPDMDQAVDFYTNVVGVAKNPQISRNQKFPSEFRNLLIQDDILTARELGRQLDEDFGFVDLLFTNPNSGSLDIAFMNTDNYFLELYKFNPNNPADADRLKASYSSPAYRNAIFPGFYLKESVDFPTYIQNLEQAAASRGWTSVKANRAVGVNVLGQNVNRQDYTRPFTTGDLAGFDYTFMKGPFDEQFSLAQFKGRSREVLQRSMKLYGAVSTAFTDTNPYFWGGFNGACGPTPPPPPPAQPAPAPGPPPSNGGTTRPPRATTRPPRRG